MSGIRKLGVIAAGAWLASRYLRHQRRMELQGASVVITGGSRGLGLELARRFAYEGARLMLLARDEEELARARDELTARGADVLVQVCDITHQAEVEHAVEAVLEHFGRVDVLVNNAGVIQVGPIEHIDLHDFEEAFGVHLWGPLYLMRAVLPHMRRQGGGRIVNITSISGVVAVPHMVPYSASKFGLVGLSDAMRAELAKDGIYVTTVVPGLMRTGSPVNAWFKGQHEAEYAWFAISDANPLLSISSGRAADKIVEACRYGDNHLAITLPARLARIANGFLPSLVGSAAKLAAWLLPGPTDATGDGRQKGWESTSRWAPSVLTRPSDEQVGPNNERPAAERGRHTPAEWEQTK